MSDMTCRTCEYFLPDGDCHTGLCVFNHRVAEFVSGFDTCLEWAISRPAEDKAFERIGRAIADGEKRARKR